MTITVEDGSIVADANSYASLADADAYHAAQGNAAWTGTDEAKESALIRAAEFLDASFAWIGRIVDDAQTMRWPRRKLACARFPIVDRDGREIAEDAVPGLVKRAQMHLALIALGASGPLVGGSGASTQTNSGPIKRVKADTVEVEFATGSAQAFAAPASNVLPNGAAEYIDRLLFGLYCAPGRPMVALGRS